MPIIADQRISKTPGIQGGAACIKETRIPVWVLVNYKRLGETEAELLEDYPSLTTDDLAAADRGCCSTPMKTSPRLRSKNYADLATTC
jgi:uncharacterized protein (DUF433 family)